MNMAPVRMSEEERDERLAVLGIAIAEKRDEATRARAESGIEKLWMECEEAYLGIDDANRGQFAGAKWAKPTSMEGPVTAPQSGSPGPKSTVFVRVTSRYVDAGSARLCEILLPIDDKSFSFGPTPVPDLVKGADDLRKMMSPTGEPIMRSALPEEQADANGQAPMTVKDVAEAQMDKASTAAEKAEKRIYDWMVECNYPAEARKVIHDAARIGVGVLKGPVPDVRKSQSLSKVPGGAALQIVKKVVPVTRWIDPWNLFPDGACGEDIHSGDGMFERDFMAPRALKRLKGQDGYINSQIDKVLKEGPGKCFTEGTNPNDPKNKKRFEIWYYTGTIKRDDMALAEAIGIDDLPADQDEVFAIVTLVNDSVIRATINPLDSGKFPYYAMPWSRRAGHWAGVGVGEQINTPQRMCNAATRRLLDNAGTSAGMQLVIDKMAIVPADGNWTMTPDKVWWKTDDSSVDDVRKAFMSVQFPNIGPQLMAIIEYAFRLAEEACNIPLLAQGQQGQRMPDTFGAAELLNTNANTLLRSIGHAYDDHINDPLVKGFYEWLLLDPSVPDDEKGDYNINAHGSSALVERAIQEQVLMQMMQMSANPAFDINPKKIFAELARAKRIDPRKIQYTDEDRPKPTAPPAAPAIEAAKIRAAADMQKTQAQVQADLQIAQLENNTSQTRIKVDTDRDTAYVNAEAERSRQESEMRMAELQVKREIEILKYSTQQKISLEEAKVQLARDSMKLNVQKELAAAAGAIDVHKHFNPPQVVTPPTEPVGRADPGHAYEQ